MAQHFLLSARARLKEDRAETTCVREELALQRARDGPPLAAVFAIHPRYPNGDRDPRMTMGDGGVRFCHVK